MGLHSEGIPYRQRAFFKQNLEQNPFSAAAGVMIFTIQILYMVQFGNTIVVLTFDAHGACPQNMPNALLMITMITMIT